MTLRIRSDIHDVLRGGSTSAYRGPRVKYSPPIFKQKNIIYVCVSRPDTGPEVGYISKWLAVLHDI